MLYLVDGVQGMTDDRLYCALGQLRDAIQTFDRRSRAVGMPYHSWSFLAIYSPEHDPFLSMTKIALPNHGKQNTSDRSYSLPSNQTQQHVQP